MHVPPAPAGLERVHLGLDMRCPGRCHVEGPGLVGVDPGHSAVHALHLELGGAGGDTRVDLAEE